MKKRFVEIDDGLDFSIKHIESGEIFYDCESVVDILNELADENEQLKKQLQSEHTMLDNAILLERTRMGQSALKQYKEAIQ